ncbi:MAG: hypothetical protein F4Y38_04530 [Gemmatimonadetes bacterium]|nr:hypothetical protein [Gemmatimonadota bacterium]
MNGILNEHIPNETHQFQFITLDPVFMELMAHPGTLRIIRTMIGEWMRLDHAYGIQMDRLTVERGHVKPNLHGGPRHDHGEHQYQWFDGKMYNGLIVVMYALEDINPGDGGLICVPGSHKSNFRYRPPVDSHLVANPSFMAGDMLIFTEALVHGTTTWTSDQRRRALLYKFSPGYSAWVSSDGLNDVRAIAANDVQRDLLRPPSVGKRTPVVIPEG